MSAIASEAPDHPATSVIHAFMDMRESCPHYSGFKETDESQQCSHENGPPSWRNWCTMDECPLLKECARENNVGWD